MSLVYIVFSLVNNHFVRTRHEELPLIMSLAGIIVTLLSIIFILYASKFMIRTRYKEIGLYSVLGMEKRHVKKVIGYELLMDFLIIGALSLLGGHLFGKLVFMLVNKLLLTKGVRPSAYPFQPKLAGAILIFLALIFFLDFIFVSRKIRLSKPLDLLKEGRKKEKEPKAKIVLIILGLVSLAIGYYLALTSEGSIDAFLTFFIAALLVIIGTYFLFNSLSILVLKAMKSKKSYYYQAENFLSVSGMLYRMKANASSLASIAVISTGVMIVLAMTLTTYLGLEDQAKKTMQSDFRIEIPIDSEAVGEGLAPAEERMDRSLEDIEEVVDVDRVYKYNTLNIFSLADSHSLKALGPEDDSDDNALMSKVSFVTVQSQEDFNRAYQQDLDLKENQLAVKTSAPKLEGQGSIEFMGQDFERIKLSLDQLGNDRVIGVDWVYLVIPEGISYEEVYDYYPYYNTNGKKMPLILYYTADIYGEARVDDIAKVLDKIGNNNSSIISNKEDEIARIYQLNGGALMLGLVVAITLLVGTFLMIYFKQMSEGFEDRKNFRIMKQVGLSDSLVKKTINKQIIWLFFLPILVALIHSIVASSLVFDILGLIGIRDLKTYTYSFLAVLAVFVLAYGLMYLLTSRLYYNIVNSKE